MHSNVGGGYDDQQLANITLAWMMAQLDPFLDFNRGYVLRQERQSEDYYHSTGQRPRPWSFGLIENSMTGVYALGGGTTRKPGEYKRVDPDNGQETDIPLQDTHEYMHPSVRARYRLRGPGEKDKGRYDPDALANWRLVVEYPDGENGKPDVYWRAKRRNMPTKILPEAPLWGIERDLADTDPDTYDYVLQPPATRSKRGGGGGFSSFDEKGHRRSSSAGHRRHSRPPSRMRDSSYRPMSRARSP